MSGLFYRTLDANQGSIVFWIRPEWNGGDGKRHDLFHNDVGNPGALSLRVESTGFLIFRAGANPVTDEVSVDVSGWVAGQTHLVVARWDNDNAEATMALASLYHSGQWDTYWKSVRAAG